MINNDCYDILRTVTRPELRGLWDGPVWSKAPVLLVGCFRREGSDHRPLVYSKLLYDESHLYGFFLVHDRYVRCVHKGFQVPVYEDSCVELFVQPVSGKGYFNFEFNCGGALLASYVTDPTRTDGRVIGAKPFSIEECRQIAVYHSLPSDVKVEIEDDVTWLLEYAVPFTLMENYAGGFGKMEGRTWRGNLYKCGNNTSHPHWASWSLLRERNFHAPWDFGTLQFAP